MWSVELVKRRTEGRGNGGAGPREGKSGPAPPSVLLVTVVGQQQVVERCCARAIGAGVRPGMSLAHARALLPLGQVRVEPFTPERDEGALRSLAEWAVRFSPLVAPDSPDGLLVDISGCERVFRGEGRLVRRLIAGVARLGFSARIAVAPTFGCAWAVSRHGQESVSIVPDGGAREAIRELPVEALRLSAEVCLHLHEIGVWRAGELLALPRSAMPARFGPELLLRLDQALGRLPETIEPVRPVELVRVERVFDGPTTQLEAIRLTARELLGAMSEELGQRESGALRIDVELKRVDAEPIRLGLVLGRPSRSRRHLWSLLEPRLERVNMGFGIERVMLTAARTGRLRHEQVEYWTKGDPGAADGASFWELIDTLGNRFGPERIGRVEAVQTHIPERAFRMRPMLGRGRRHEKPEGAGIAPWDRPSLLFDRPEPARVIAVTPDGPLSRVGWRGEEHVVVSCDGPERLSPEWWRDGGVSAGATRDYFKVRDETGRVLWVYRELEANRWYVHGAWE